MQSSDSKRMTVEDLKIAAFFADNAACGHYRVLYPMHYLRKAGAKVRTYERVHLSDLLWADLIVAQRQYSSEILTMLETARNLGRRIVYEVDDDLHAVHPSSRAFHVYRNGSPQLRRVGRAMRISDALTVSTPELASVYRSVNPHVYVLPNYLDLDLRPWGALEPRLPEERDKIVIGWAGGSCYSPDTEVLTKDGFKLFQDVSPDDKLATLNLETGELQYQKPLHLVVSVCTDHLYTASTDRVSFSVTSNHWMVVSDKDGVGTVQMQDLDGEDFVVLKAPRFWAGTKPKTLKLGGLSLPVKDWVSICALWLAGGSSGTSFDCRDPLLARKLVKHLSGFVSVSLSDGRVDFIDQRLKQVASSWKRLPDEIRDLSSENLFRLLDCFMRFRGYALGYSVRDDEVELDLPFPAVVDDLYDLLLKTGGALDILPAEEKGLVRVRIYFPKSRKLTRLIKAKEVRKQEYRGVVYCAVVPNHTLYVRREGAAFWCGNTHQDDFSVVGGALRQVLIENPNTVFSICTSKDQAELAAAVMNLPRESVVFIPPVPFEVYPSRLSHFDIGIAPLVKTRFNDAKSELRCLEYGAYGIPCVASRLPAYNAWIRNGVDGFTAGSEGEWYLALTRLVRDAELRTSFGQEAKRRVYSERNLADHIDEWVDVYCDVMMRPREWISDVPGVPKREKVGRNDPCPRHPEYKLKKCPHGCVEVYR